MPQKCQRGSALRQKVSRLALDRFTAGAPPSSDGGRKSNGIPPLLQSPSTIPVVAGRTVSGLRVEGGVGGGVVPFPAARTRAPEHAKGSATITDSTARNCSQRAGGRGGAYTSL